MTATDELRRMLDERRVEWWKTSYGRGTVWDGEYGTVVAVESEEVLSMLYDTDPAQAIEATLGRGTCHDESGGDPCVFVCSCCGTAYDHPEDQTINFCPNCGKRVVAGDES